MKKNKLVPAVVFQRNLRMPEPVARPARLVLFETELGHITGGLAKIDTLTYDGPGQPGDSMD
jgi:hypothetical protein